MNLFENTINCISIFILLVFATFYLRARGILKSSNAPTIARLITELILPAYLFHQLAFANLSIAALKAAGSLIIVEIILASLSYPLGKYLLKMNGSTLAIFVLCSTFSSTGLLGNSFLKLIYDTDAMAIAQGIIIGQLAITTPNYLLTPAILSQFQSTNKKNSLSFHLHSFFFNPPNLAIFLGLLWAFLNIETNQFFLEPIFGSMKLMGETISFLVALSIGLSLKHFPERKDLRAILICGFFILIAEPILAYFIDQWTGAKNLDQQVSFLLGAMPAAPIIAVYAIRYETDPKFASTLITATTVMSAVTIPILMFCFRSLLM
ncbi:MAG: AEC family transporter [Hyphomicrobium sp.]